MPAKDANAFFGKAVRSLREEAGLTQEQVADRSESRLSASWISNVEQGKVDPTRHTVRNIARGIGVLPSQIEALTEVLEGISQQEG
ncbi:MAG TPA: helix-turn-helix transcriptional regulator [Solirubrobacterales bacterium]|nr:helix-turn-helix transcriptional regulator [Solirubrobacterales bacterium]